MGPDEGVLGDFLGVAAIPQERQGEAEDFFAVARHDFEERGFIAGVEAADEFGVVSGVGAGGEGSFGERAGGRYASGRNRGGRGVGIHGILWFKRRTAMNLPRNVPTEYCVVLSPLFASC